MGVDREYRIKILTVADNSGADAAGGALEGLGQKQEMAGKAAEKHGEHLHTLHKLFHSLDEIVPGLGVAMQAAFSPIGATISLAVMALRLFHDKMKEVNAEFDRMSEEAAKPLTHRLEAMREATVQTATGMAELRDKLDQAAKGQQTLKVATEEAIGGMREQVKEYETLAEALKSNELAQAEAMHEAGLLSEQQYSDRRLEIELEYRKKKRAIAEREEMTEILMKRRVLETAEGNQADLTKAAEAAEKKKVAALEDLGSLRSRAEIDEDRNKSDAALRAFEREHGPNTRFGDLIDQFEKIGPGTTSQGAELWMQANNAKGGIYHVGGSDLYEEWATRKTVAMLAESEWQQAPGIEARRKVAADAASREAERAARRAEENQGFITDTGRELGLRRGQFDERHKANAESDALDADTLKLQAFGKSPGDRAMGGLVGDVAVAENALQHGQAISVKQQSEIATLKQILESIHMNFNQVAQALGGSVNNNQAILQLIQIILAAQAKQQAQINSLHSNAH